MCFSIEASSGMLVLGIIATIISAYKINWKTSLLIGYYSIMQIIHILGYLTINDCNNNLNKFASYANYIHICFQPFITILGLYGLGQFLGYNDKNSGIKIQYAFYISFVIGIFLFMRMFNGLSDNSQTSTINSKSCIWCGKACSFKGEKHINFSLPLRNPEYDSPSLFLHMFGMFILPLFINKFITFSTILLFILTIVPAYMHGIRTSEAGTIWCFTSIFQAIFIILVGLFWKK